MNLIAALFWYLQELRARVQLSKASLHHAIGHYMDPVWSAVESGLVQAFNSQEKLKHAENEAGEKT